MEIPIDIWLRGDNHATSHVISPVTREPRRWTDGDVTAVLVGMLRALERASRPDADELRTREPSTNRVNERRSQRVTRRFAGDDADRERTFAGAGALRGIGGGLEGDIHRTSPRPGSARNETSGASAGAVATALRNAAAASSRLSPSR